MQDFTIPEHVTIETHRVQAGYEIHGTGNSIPVGINGFTLNDIVNDLIDFFNGMEEHEKFATWQVTHHDNYEFIQVMIHGWLARFDAERGDTDELAVNVTVNATRI